MMGVGALVHARVAEVIFGATEPKSGALISTTAAHAAPGLNHRFNVIQAIREEQCRELIQAFFREKRRPV